MDFKIKYVLVLTLTFFSLKNLFGNDQQSFNLVSTRGQATIFIDQSEPEFLKLAVKDLIIDVKKITGKELKVVSNIKDCGESCVIVGTVSNPSSAKILNKFFPKETSAIKGQWESYRVKSINKKVKPIKSALVVAGSDERGTMFGLYHFIEEYLNVDPFYFWTGIEPKKRNHLSWENVNISQDEPSFKYRGWFINDEDLLTEFINGGGNRDLDYPYYGQVVHPDAFKPVVEALVRSRYNLIIPASFIDIMNEPERRLVEESAKRGLFLSQHHVEPMGVSAFTFFNYWRSKGKDPKFSFYSNRKEVEEVWKLYASEWAKFPNVIWQIGLRGIADRPMWMADPNVPQSDADRGALISEAMQVQMEMIKAVDKRENPLVTTTLWAEGAGLNQDGHLTFPENTIIVFADNSPGWKWQKDFYETKREEGRNYGVYYHHQLWGSGPHLVQAVPPSQTYQMFSLAAKHHADHYAIMNVSNIREFVLGIEASSDMLWDFEAFDPDIFTKNWIEEMFGKSSEAIEQAYQAFFESFQLHPVTQSPYTLDGQVRSYGNRQLNNLKLQINDPEKYRLEQEIAKKKSEEGTWGSRFLSDMHPESGVPPKEYLNVLNTQAAGLEKAGKYIEEAKKELSGDKLHFLVANLEVQQEIMLAINNWASYVIQAKLAEDNNDRKAAIDHLTQAVDEFQKIKDAKAIASTGKWEHWYRGDKKMNLPAVEKNTKEVLQLAKEKSKSENLTN